MTVAGEERPGLRNVWWGRPRPRFARRRSRSLERGLRGSGVLGEDDGHGPLFSAAQEASPSAANISTVPALAWPIRFEITHFLNSFTLWGRGGTSNRVCYTET